MAGTLFWKQRKNRKGGLIPASVYFPPWGGWFWGSLFLFEQPVRLALGEEISQSLLKLLGVADVGETPGAVVDHAGC